MMENRPKIFISEDDNELLTYCRVETMKSGGKGGQHVNTTDSAVRITHIQTGVSAKSQKSRSHHSNKEEALKVLRKKLVELNKVKKARKKTKIPKSVKQKNLDKKKKHSLLKKSRVKQRREDTTS